MPKRKPKTRKIRQQVSLYPRVALKKPKKEPRRKLPELQSTLTSSFDLLSGGWRNYIRVVEIAARSAKSDDDPMVKMFNTYQKLNKKRQDLMTPEALCLESGVDIMTFLQSIMPWVWTYSNTKAAMISAAANPAVIERTVRAALGSGRNSHKDRETFLKITGAIPTARGSQTIINNTPIAQSSSQAAQMLPIQLPSASQDIIDYDESDANYIEGETGETESGGE